MKKLNLKTVLLVLSGCILLTTTEQSQAGDLQRRREAVRLFVNKQYVKALPLFAQLVSNHPENYKFNYYYGVCLLIADKDKAKAVEHLETSLKNPKSPEDVYYYLAKAYHLCYMCDEGVRAINEFNKMVREKQRVKFKTEDINVCLHNARRLLDSSKNSTIREYIPATPEDFYSKYAFEGNYGKILRMPDELKTRKSDDENPTIFLSADGNVMFFSSYANETNSRDIFRSIKMPDGAWGKPERLDANVNSNKDELFPTCSPDGHVLYFSSMGHNSTGGFDIYKSVLIRSDNKWTEAENMGSPYNSPFDDYNFVPSGEDKFAYFTSTRSCSWGQLMVCKVDYNSGEQLPIQIQGKLSCINDPSLKLAKITVTRIDTETEIAALTTDPLSGMYSCILPCAGTYSFKVEAEGFQPHMQVATFSEFGDKFFIQKIYLSKDQAGVEDLAINNLRESDMARLQENLMAAEDENGVNMVSATDVAKKTMPVDSGSGFTAENASMIATDAAATKSTTGDATAINSASKDNETVEFRVQVGAFKKQSVAESKRILSKKTKNPLTHDNFDKQWNKFFVGHEDSYAKANNLKAILQMAGFKGAFIVAYKKNAPVPLSTLDLRKGE